MPGWHKWTKWCTTVAHVGVLNLFDTPIWVTPGTPFYPLVSFGALVFTVCSQQCMQCCFCYFFFVLCFVFFFFNSSSLFVIDVNKCATKWCAKVTRMSVLNLVWHTNMGYPGTPFFPLAQFDFIVGACNAFLLRLFLCFVYCFHSFVIAVHFLLFLMSVCVTFSYYIWVLCS